jgi:superfamily II DNA/RNA helicase/cold shock CspA family protein
MTTPFAHLGLPVELCRALSRTGIDEPFAIQTATIPDALAGRDVVAQAPTGSGKTLAFGLPLLARTGHGRPARPASMVVVPTRELADQIVAALAPLASALDLRIATFYGGVGFREQQRALRRGVDVAVGCPGRMEDLVSQGLLDLGDVRFAVLDEADRMADVGFLPAVRRLLGRTPAGRQTLLFSATMGEAVASLVDEHLHEPTRHVVDVDVDEADTARHLFLSVGATERARWAAEAIRHSGPTIVFCRTRRRADRIAQQISRLGVTTDVLHGGRSQGQRTRALDQLASGRVQALVATDVAARGIHVDGLACVVHLDPPEDAAAYTHRSGRTGRAGASGVVLSLVDAADVDGRGRLRRPPAPGVEYERTTTEALSSVLRPTGEPAAPAGPARAPRAERTAPARSEARTERVGPQGVERGRVKFFDSARGFGFITRPDGSELFVHHTQMGAFGKRPEPQVGDGVTYRVEPGRKGLEAHGVRPAAARTPQAGRPRDRRRRPVPAS